MAKVKALVFAGIVIAAGILVFHAHGQTGWPVHAGNEKRVQGNLYVKFALSPNGKTIVFSGAGLGGKDLYTMNLKTRKVTALTHSTDYENDPVYSPDGKSIAYIACKSLNDPRYLYVRSLDGKHVRQLTHGTPTADAAPSFSPNGKRIVFSRAHRFLGDRRGEDTWDDADVYVIGIDGSKLTRLTKQSSQAAITPVFTPDGKCVLFEDYNPDLLQSKIVRIDARTGRLPHTIIAFGDAGDASFVPGSKQMVFVSNNGNGPELYVTAYDGRQPRSLNTRRFGSGGDLHAITPDGKTVLYFDGYDMDLHQINLDGTHHQLIATGALFSDPLNWHG